MIPTLINQKTLSRPQQWRVILPASIGMVLSLSGDLTLYTILPVTYSQLALSLVSVGILLSANRFIRLGSNPLVGVLIDRYGRRKPVLAGLGLGTLATLLYALNSGFGLFLLGRLLWGISWSLIYIGVYSMVLDVTTSEDRGWGSGVLQAFYYIGLTINPLIGGFLHDRIGFPAAMLSCALLTGLGFLIALFGLPETQEDRLLPNEPAGWRAFRAWIFGIRASYFAPGWLARSVRGISTNYLYALTIFIGDGIIMSTLSLYLKQQFGEGLAASGLVMYLASFSGALQALRSITAAIIAPFAGSWSDRTGKRLDAVGWGLGLGVVGMVALAFAPRIWFLVPAVALIAASGGIAATVLPAIIGDESRKRNTGIALGLLTTAGDIGSAIAPLATYALLAVIPLTRVYLLAAMLLATGLPIIFMISKRTGALRVC